MLRYVSHYLLLGALSLALIVIPCQAGPERGLSPKALDNLVEAVLDAHGGRKALQKVHTLKVVGRLKAILIKDQGTGTVYYQQPDKLLSDNHYGRSREVRILNGSKGWIKTGDGFEAAPSGVMIGMQYSLISYKLPLELARMRDRLTYLGRVEQLGKRFEVLELVYSKGLKVRVYVESESKRIAQVAGYIKVGERTVILSRVLGDYRDVDGVIYPFHQKYHSGPTIIAEKWVEAVEVNSPFGEVKFAPE